MSKEFRVPIYGFDICFPSWLVPLQWLATISKFVLLVYMAFYMDKVISAILLFVSSWIFHLLIPAFPYRFYYKAYCKRADYIREFVDEDLGIEFEKMLRAMKFRGY